MIIYSPKKALWIVLCGQSEAVGRTQNLGHFISYQVNLNESGFIMTINFFVMFIHFVSFFPMLPWGGIYVAAECYDYLRWTVQDFFLSGVL